jgi:hypothetical protein
MESQERGNKGFWPQGLAPCWEVGLGPQRGSEKFRNRMGWVAKVSREKSGEVPGPHLVP